jgi:pheromone shutdown protein TraB
MNNKERVNVETNVEFEKAEVKKPSLFGMISSPGIQFERMKENAPIGLPLLLMIVLMAIGGALVSYLSLDNPVIKEINATAEMKIPLALTLSMGAFGAGVGGAISFFIIAAFYKICMVFMGNDTPYKKLLVLTIYTSIISAVGVFVNGIIALLVGGYETTYTSLAPLVGENVTLKAIAGNFDVFHLWYYVVIAIGLQIMAGLSKNKAIILVVILFLISIGFSSLSGLFPQLGN